MEYRIEKLSDQTYLPYLAVVKQTQWGNLLLPNEYGEDLWGGVVYENDILIGGWVGVYRGNKRFVKWLAKSIYFDSYPIFTQEEYTKEYQSRLIDTMREWAKDEHIVMFNLTHWVRGNSLAGLDGKQNATFLLPLQDDEEAQMTLIERTQRNKIRKGEKNGVEVRALRGDEALAELPTLQLLRAQTQNHAIRNNANASMLLKSDNFFANLLRHTDATLFIGSVEGKPATAALMLASGETVYYYSGGSDYELNRQTGSSAYVLWKALVYYRNQKGIKYMDMGGVPVRPDESNPAYGVYVFKRSFGGEYMEFDSGMMPINKFKYTILKFALSQRKLLRLFSKTF